MYISHPYCPQKINASMIFLDEKITLIEKRMKECIGIQKTKPTKRKDTIYKKGLQLCKFISKE